MTLTTLTVFKTPTHQTFLALLGAASLVLSGCGGGGGGGGGGGPASTTPPSTSDVIVYGRNRDLITDQIIPVLAEDGSGFDAAEVDSPAVLDDAGRAASPPVVGNNDRFMLFYEATSNANITTIGLITSSEEDFDSLVQGRLQVIGLGGGGSGFDTAATDPTVLRDVRAATPASLRYRMWFEGRSGTSSSIIYCDSADGVTWNNFAICTGLTPSFGSVRVADPSVVLDNNVTPNLFRMWFEAVNSASGGIDGPGTIGYADSTDGINWTVRDAAGNTGASAGPVYVNGGAGSFDAYSVNAPTVVLDDSLPAGTNGYFKLWYEAGDDPADTMNSIGYATSGDGLTWSDPTLPILNPSSDSIVPLPFDSGDVEHPCAVIIGSIPENIEGHFLLYYSGDSENSTTPNRIGLASGRTGP